MEIFNQSVFETWPIADKSIQALITSPPYWSLRKYDIPDVFIGDWKGQYGLEPTFKLYLEHTKLWLREAIRVLRDDGVIFVNLADSYSTKSGGMAEGKYGKLGASLENSVRFAIMCVDELNLICRNHIVWFKPNGMPESVTDRFSKKWESIFMLTKKPDYYFDLDAVREEHSEATIQRVKYPTGMGKKYINNNIGQPKGTFEHILEKGKNPGDVFQIPTQPSSEKHFAMWPEKLVERMVLCSTKKWDTVLDCFAGSCTTGRVAIKHQRKFIGIDLGYQEMQARRSKNIQVSLPIWKGGINDIR